MDLPAATDLVPWSFTLPVRPAAVAMAALDVLAPLALLSPSSDEAVVLVDFVSVFDALSEPPLEPHAAANSSSATKIGTSLRMMTSRGPGLSLSTTLRGPGMPGREVDLRCGTRARG